MRRLGPLLAVALAALGLVAPAGAKIVQVGPNLGSATAEGHFECGGGGTCLFAQKTPSYTAPVTGAIVEWQLKGATGQFLFWVLDGNTGTVQSSFGEAESGKSSFPVSLPITKGERFGVEIFREGDKLGYTKPAGATVSGWTPTLAPGETRAPDKNVPEAELLANVKILPAPGITSVSPASGPVQSLDTVTITGHDFIDVTGVTFGGTLANYEVRSETELVAEAFAFDLGAAAVSVSTVAGTATAPGAFTFEPAAPEVTPPGETPGGLSNPISPVVIPPVDPVDIPPVTFPKEAPECHVPKLKGKTLKQAKPLLTAAHCKLGKVTKRKGVKATRGKVVAEIPPTGARAGNGWPVKVTLG